MATIIYTTDGHLHPGVQKFAIKELMWAAGDVRVVEYHQDPKAKRSTLQMYFNLLAMLAMIPDGVCYLVEHDVLYPPGYFVTDPTLASGICYARGGYVLTRRGYIKRRSPPLSTVLGDRAMLHAALVAKVKLALTGRVKWAEPGRDDAYTSDVTHRRLTIPYVDVRHGGNLTGDRKAKSYIDTIPYWGDWRSLWAKMGIEV